MKAVQLTAVGRPLEERDVPLPAVGDHDVLVRIRAGGICHSDAHYRAGRSTMGPLPLTLGHEIAGEVERAGRAVSSVSEGDRVCLHYLLSCGACVQCIAGRESYCVKGAMLGHHVDGGYATHIVVPERNAVRLPDEIPLAHGAVMMCSSATALHALAKARFVAGESVAIYGTGGLGMSAIQIAHAMGADGVFAVDIDPQKLRLAGSFGVIPVDASDVVPDVEVRRLTGGKGVHVSLEFAGLPVTTQQAVRSLAIGGRCVVAGITHRNVEIDTRLDLLANECEIIGSNDHSLSEIHTVLELARSGRLDLSSIIGGTVPLEANAINDVLTQLESFSAPVRTVILQD